MRDWLDQWLAIRGKLRPNTRRNYRYLFDQHLIPALGTLLLAELDLPSAQTAFDAMSRVGRGTGPFSASTLTRARAALRTALNAAVPPAAATRPRGSPHSRVNPQLSAYATALQRHRGAPTRPPPRPHTGPGNMKGGPPTWGEPPYQLCHLGDVRRQGLEPRTR